MIKHFGIKSIKDVAIKNKQILVRVDFDVPLNDDGTIVDDTRIEKNIDTLKSLLQNRNKLILIAKLGRPKGKDPKLSLNHVVKVLPKYLPGYSFKLIDDFLTEPQETFLGQQDKRILVLENIRYYSDKEREDPAFLSKLCSLGEVYVNDAFAMAHRDETTITGIPSKMLGYAGLLLEDEVNTIMHVVKSPKKPVVSIIGGAKIETKVEPIKKLITMSDHILLGGGIANTFLKAHGFEIGKSLYDAAEVPLAQELIDHATDLPVIIHLPIDARIGDINKEAYDVVTLAKMPKNGKILDIGPHTSEIYEEIIESAETIVWNGPMGLFENDSFRKGTDEIYRALLYNNHAFSLVGGGDTLAALHRKRQKNSLGHLSTGGGAMYDLIEHESLPALEALVKSQHRFAS